MDNNTSRRDFLGGTGVAAAGALGAGMMATQVAQAQTAAPAAAPASKNARLKALVTKGDHFDVPFIPDVITARMCESLGFPALFTGGNWCASGRHGLPDFGLMTISELVAFGAHIAEHVDIPVLSDGDDAGGSANNAYRATQRFERAGVSGVMYDDTLPVRGMTPSRRQVIPIAEMVDKIKATADARVDPDFLVIGRTDAISAGLGMDVAMERGRALAEAGADVLYMGGLKLEDHARARGILKVPLMTSPADTVPVEEVRAARVTIAFRHLEPIGAGAIYQAMLELKSTGRLVNSTKLKLSRDVEGPLLHSADWLERAKKYHLITA